MHCLAQGDRTNLTTHSGLSDTLSLIDLFYKRMLNFVYRCLNSQSSLVNFVTDHGIFFGQMNFVVGRNLLNCSLCYSSSVDYISKLDFSPHGIDKYANATEGVLNTRVLLLEPSQCRDGSSSLSN